MRIWSHLHVRPELGPRTTVSPVPERRRPHIARGTSADARYRSLLDDLHQVARIAKECEALARSFPLNGESACPHLQHIGSVQQQLSSAQESALQQPWLYQRNASWQSINFVAQQHQQPHRLQRPPQMAFRPPPSFELGVACIFRSGTKHPLADYPGFAEGKRLDPSRHTRWPGCGLLVSSPPHCRRRVYLAASPHKYIKLTRSSTKYFITEGRSPLEWFNEAILVRPLKEQP
ncbi:hypothetical protein Efla_004628 [Eimeria flavescens]